LHRPAKCAHQLRDVAVVVRGAVRVDEDRLGHANVRHAWTEGLRQEVVNDVAQPATDQRRADALERFADLLLAERRASVIRPREAAEPHRLVHALMIELPEGAILGSVGHPDRLSNESLDSRQ